MGRHGTGHDIEQGAVFIKVRRSIRKHHWFFPMGPFANMQIKEQGRPILGMELLQEVGGLPRAAIGTLSIGNIDDRGRVRIGVHITPVRHKSAGCFKGLPHGGISFMLDADPMGVGNTLGVIGNPLGLSGQCRNLDPGYGSPGFRFHGAWNHVTEEGDYPVITIP